MMLILVLGTAIALSSCSKDDDDNSSSSNLSELVGTWYYDNGNWTYTLTLRNNGTFSQRKESRLGSTGGAEGVYKVSGSTVTLTGTSWTLYSGGDFEEDDDYNVSLTYSSGKLSYSDGDYYTKK